MTQKDPNEMQNKHKETQNDNREMQDKVQRLEHKETRKEKTQKDAKQPQRDDKLTYICISFTKSPCKGPPRRLCFHPCPFVCL